MWTAPALDSCQTVKNTCPGISLYRFVWKAVGHTVDGISLWRSFSWTPARLGRFNYSQVQGWKECSSTGRVTPCIYPLSVQDAVNAERRCWYGPRSSPVSSESLHWIRCHIQGLLEPWQLQHQGLMTILNHVVAATIFALLHSLQYQEINLLKGEWL
jgi:hypothetical protein